MVYQLAILYSTVRATWVYYFYHLPKISLFTMLLFLPKSSIFRENTNHLGLSSLKSLCHGRCLKFAAKRVFLLLRSQLHSSGAICFLIPHFRSSLCWLEIQRFLLAIIDKDQAVVAYTFNSSVLGGRGRGISGS